MSGQRVHTISRLAAAPTIPGGVGVPTVGDVVVVVVDGGNVVVVDGGNVVVPAPPQTPTHTRTDAVGPVSLSVLIVMSLAGSTNELPGARDSATGSWVSAVLTGATMRIH